jgi:hypothetical protein
MDISVGAAPEATNQDVLVELDLGFLFVIVDQHRFEFKGTHSSFGMKHGRLKMAVEKSHHEGGLNFAEIMRDF